MTPQDVEKAIDRIVEHRNGLITGANGDVYCPGVFEKIAADLRVLRQVQANTIPAKEIVRTSPGHDGLYRMPAWTQEHEH